MYNLKLVYDYINGENIEDVEKLEDGSSFMMQVIIISKDKNMYELCSDNLKKDFDFVKFLILKFSDVLDFIANVADYYLKYSKDSDDSIEKTSIYMLISELTKGKIDMRFYKYHMYTSSLLNGFMVFIEGLKLEIKDSEILKEVGLGFTYIYDKYKGEDIILNFYACNMIEYIFDEYNIDLEQLFHDKYKSVDEIISKGINACMLEFISNYDNMLSSYLKCHIDLLDDLKKRIIYIINNWDKYEDDKLNRQFDNIIGRIYDYFDDGEYSSLGATFFLYYVAREYGVMDELALYDGLDKKLFDEIKSDLDYDMSTGYLDDMNEEIVHYNFVRQVFNEELFDNQINSIPRRGNVRALTLPNRGTKPYINNFRSRIIPIKN